MINRTPRFRIFSRIEFAVAMLLLSLSMSVSAIELGRLFYYPAERGLLNHARQPGGHCLAMMGILLKDGKDLQIWMAWDKVWTRRDGRSPVRIEEKADSDASVRFWITADESALVKPGQTFDFANRETRDAFDTRLRACPEQYLTSVR